MISVADHIGANLREIPLGIADQEASLAASTIAYDHEFLGI